LDPRARVAQTRAGRTEQIRVAVVVSGVSRSRPA
jgi:hypothetical protein